MRSNRTYAIFGAAALVFAVALGLHLSRSDVTSVQPPETPPLTVGAGGGALDGTLRLSYAYTHGALHRGADSLDLVIDVDAKDLPGSQTPVDLAIVLDTSGSMVGDKLAKAQAATRLMLRQLRPGDRAALIAYSTEPEVVFGLTDVGSAPGRFVDQVDRLVASGGTNIEGGIGAAIRVLGAADRGRVQRIMLVSDGRATVGATDSGVLARLAGGARQGGVSVTTMGLGADYNELLMVDMARRGGGNYYFIDSAASLREVFAAEVNSLQKLVARDVTLHLDLGPGVSLRRVSGFPWKSTPTGVVVSLNSFSGGQNKSMVVSMDVSSLRSASSVTPVSLRLRYSDLVQDRLVNAALRGVPLAVVDGLNAFHASRNRDALVRVQAVRAAAAYDEAMLRYEEGRAADAEKILRGASRELRGISGDLGGISSLVEQADKADKAAEEAVAIDPATPRGRTWLKGNRYDSYKLMKSK